MWPFKASRHNERALVACSGHRTQAWMSPLLCDAGTCCAAYMHTPADMPSFPARTCCPDTRRTRERTQTRPDMLCSLPAHTSTHAKFPFTHILHGHVPADRSEQADQQRSPKRPGPSKAPALKSPSPATFPLDVYEKLVWNSLGVNFHVSRVCRRPAARESQRELFHMGIPIVERTIPL